MHAYNKMRAKMRAISRVYLRYYKQPQFLKHIIINTLHTTHKQQNPIFESYQAHLLKC
nr:MAG TPA: hypothetical protein [Caudoviricetes sp.]